ncbi:MAG: CopG family transcriptional regulator [bacterium]
MKNTTKKFTIYFDPNLHNALKIKSAFTHHTISEIVNDIIKRALAEDAEDLAAFEERAKEPNLDFETVLKSLKNSGKI